MKILVIGSTILATDVTDMGDWWESIDQHIPKTVAPDAVLVDAMLPVDYAPGRFKWEGGQIVALPPVPEPITEDHVREYDGHVQARLDAVALGFNYGDPNRPEVSPIMHAISYAEEPAVPKFQAEGRALRAWRSLYWQACWPILEAVKAGQRPIPTPEQLIEELDASAPPPVPSEIVY